MSAGICRYCGCTDTRPCEGGCGWTDDTRTVCSQCRAALEIASKVVEVLGHVTVLRHLKAGREASGNIVWGNLAPKEQRLLVMTCRATVDGYREALIGALTEDAVASIAEVNAIDDFLCARCPDEIHDEAEAISATVIRLLTPHVGRRVVLAGGGA